LDSINIKLKPTAVKILSSVLLAWTLLANKSVAETLLARFSTFKEFASFEEMILSQ